MTGRAAARAALVGLLLTSCATLPSASVTPATSGEPGASQATSGGEPTPAPVPGTPPPVAGLEELCRRQVFMTGGELSPRLTDAQRNAWRPVMTVVDPGYVFQISTDGSQDFQCVAYVEYIFPQVDATGWGYRMVDGLDEEHPIWVGPSGSHGVIQYVWGAVGPDVASVVAENDDGVRTEARIEQGYFAALMSSGPCCVFSVYAYDAAGSQLWPIE